MRRVRCLWKHIFSYTHCSGAYSSHLQYSACNICRAINVLSEYFTEANRIWKSNWKLTINLASGTPSNKCCEYKLVGQLFFSKPWNRMFHHTLISTLRIFGQIKNGEQMSIAREGSFDTFACAWHHVAHRPAGYLTLLMMRLNKRVKCHHRRRRSSHCTLNIKK